MMSDSQILTLLILVQLLLSLYAHCMWRRERTIRLRTEAALCEALAEADTLRRVVRGLHEQLLAERRDGSVTDHKE
jgi:hypothetical protein